jgi:hypothetical protein
MVEAVSEEWACPSTWTLALPSTYKYAPDTLPELGAKPPLTEAPPVNAFVPEMVWLFPVSTHVEHEIVTAPAEPLTDIGDDAPSDVTPVLVTTTAPVVGDTEIPAPLPETEVTGAHPVQVPLTVRFWTATLA